MRTPEEQVEELKRQGGVDVTQMEVGTSILIETTMAVYEMFVIDPADAIVQIQGTDQIFSAARGRHQARLLFSSYDTAGEVSIPNWIGKSLRLGLQSASGVVIMTSAVMSARITSPDGSWSYELWEKV